MALREDGGVAEVWQGRACSSTDMGSGSGSGCLGGGAGLAPAVAPEEGPPPLPALPIAASGSAAN